jgi:F-type H+-transporting ATPase subunit gamma
MPNLKVLRQRISSIQSTLKITSAMKMVAASKLKKSQHERDFYFSYENTFKDMVQEARFQLDPLEGDLGWFAPSPSSPQKVALVIMSSSRGLCGSFNNMIIKESKMLLKQFKTQGMEVDLFIIGRKAKDSLGQKYPHTFLNDPDTKNLVKQLSLNLSQDFQNGKYKAVHVLFNAYHSTLVQKPFLMNLLPLAIPAIQTVKNAICMIEPSPSFFLERSCKRYVEILIYKALLESSLGEQASRMIAMDSATRSAKDMLENLKLQFNRTRQGLITKELIEVISGAEAAL